MAKIRCACGNELEAAYGALACPCGRRVQVSPHGAAATVIRIQRDAAKIRARFVVKDGEYRRAF